MSVTLDVDDEPTRGLDADGRPDPAYAAGLGLVPATGGRRSAAFALDALIWVALATPGVIGASLLLGTVVSAGGNLTTVATGDLVFPLVLTGVSQGLLFVFGLAQLILHGRKALTVGKAAFGLRSVNVARFDAPGFWRIVWRAVVLWGAQVVLPFVGPAVLFASSTWDADHRGRSWLDRVGRSYVIDVRRGLNPFDAKALRHARRALAAPTAAVEPRLPSLATDRGVDEHTFIPAARSSSGVVTSALGDWEPPAIGATSGSSSPAAAPASIAAPTSVAKRTTSFVLRFDDGTAIVATARGLLGRVPASGPGEPPATLVPLDDESMRISKTHAEFGVADEHFWLTDRASKNGTIVELPSGGIRSLTPGEPMMVPAGSTVTIGGRRFTVEYGDR